MIYNDDFDDEIFRPSNYLPKLKDKISNFLISEYGIYTDITFKTQENINLDTIVEYKGWDLENTKWSDDEVLKLYLKEIWNYHLVHIIK